MGEAMPTAALSQRWDLEALDRGLFEEAAARYEPSPGPTPSLLWQVEVAIYLGRLDEAKKALQVLGRLLDGCEESLSDKGAPARRRLALEAAYHVERDDWRRAREKSQYLVTRAEMRGDVSAAFRAWFVLARSAALEGEHYLALESLAHAGRLAATSGNEYWEGLVDLEFGRAVAAYGDRAAGERRLRDAVDRLGRCGDLRARARAATALADLLVEGGRDVEAIAYLDATPEMPGRRRDGDRADLVRSRALVGIGRAEDAIDIARRLVASEVSDLIGPAHAVLARALFAVDDVEGAAVAAGEALRRARVADAAWDRIEAQIVLSKATARAGGGEGAERAIADLWESLAEADERELKVLGAEVRAALAEALLLVSPLEAEELLADAHRIASSARATRAIAEVERVERLRAAAPVRVDAEGCLVLDPRRGFPTLKGARESVERFWVAHAVAREGGNWSAAGRLLGETPRQIFYVKKTYFDRGDRGRAPSDADFHGNGTARRRKPR